MIVENPYQNYPTWPGKEGFYESTMPPGNILKLYVNDLALDTFVNKRGMFPDGALLIKENYTEDRKLSPEILLFAREEQLSTRAKAWDLEKITLFLQ